MNKAFVLALILSVALSNRAYSGSFVPVRAGVPTTVNFACGDAAADATSSGYSFRFGSLPSWVSSVSGSSISGVPTSGAPTAIQVYYTDANGNSGSRTVVLAGEGTSGSATVSLPAGATLTGVSTAGAGAAGVAGATGAAGVSGVDVSTTSTVTLASLPSLQYVIGSTSPAGGRPAGPGGAPSGPAGSGPFGPSGPNGFAPGTTTQTTTTTVILPSLVTPATRVTLVAPVAPTTLGVRPTAPTSNPEEDLAVTSRAEAAYKGVVNALDAVNKANANFNNIQALLDSNNVDINNAAEYFQSTRTSLRKANDDRNNNNGQITVVTTDINNLQTQVDAHNNDINNLNNQIRDLQNNLDSAGPAVNDAVKKLDEINNNINNINIQITDANGRIDAGNTKAATLQKTISDTQAILDNWPGQVAAARTAVNTVTDRIDKLRRELDDAIAEQGRLNATLNEILALKNTAPKTIADAKALLETTTAAINGDRGTINRLNVQLTTLNTAKTTAEDNINKIKAGAGDIGRRLADLRNQVRDKQAALARYQSQWTQATAALTQLRNNEGVLNSNVEVLTEQLTIAETQVTDTNRVRSDLSRQLGDAERLIQASRVALENARTEKDLADQALRETIQRTGQTFTFPYLPGTGPYAMPGVTGNPATGTSNPYAPGTIFGTGRDTTGNGLPLAAAPGSPYNNLVTQRTYPTGTRTVSGAQATNTSPSAIYPVGSGSFTAGTSGFVLGRGLNVPFINNVGTTVGVSGSGCGAPAGANVISGSAVISNVSPGWWSLNNGVRVQVQGCTQGASTCGQSGKSVSWNGYQSGGNYVVTSARCN